MNEEEKKEFKRIKKQSQEAWLDDDDIKFLVDSIDKLQKENEELKKSKITYEKVRDIQEKNKNIVDKNYIPVQKVKDKISERQFELQQEYKDFEDDAILIVLQELLEGRK